MNGRQEILYNYLIERGDVWTTQEQIAYDLSHWYDVSTFAGSETFHDSKTRFDIGKDIKFINEDPTVDKLIISSPCGIKIATEQEAFRFISLEYASVFRRLKRVRNKEKKANLNNQVTIDGKAISAFLENFEELY